MRIMFIRRNQVRTFRTTNKIPWAAIHQNRRFTRESLHPTTRTLGSAPCPVVIQRYYPMENSFLKRLKPLISLPISFILHLYCRLSYFPHRDQKDFRDKKAITKHFTGNERRGLYSLLSTFQRIIAIPVSSKKKLLHLQKKFNSVIIHRKH
jgi:hypothetical protein